MTVKGLVYRKEDVEELNKITQTKLLLLKLKEEINGKKSNQHRVWAVKDVEYLINNYPVLSLEELAKNLNRSVSGVKEKANKLGLKRQYIYNDKIRICELLTYFKTNYINYTWFVKILEQYNCPIYLDKNNFKTVDLNEFLKWFKNHLHLLDIYSAKTPFKNPPEWLKEKIQADLRACEYIKKRRWTKEEDEKLIDMINKNFDYKTICMTLKRTGGALKRRMLDLKIEKRPKRVKQNNKIKKWTDAEIETVKTLYKKGYKPCIIQEYINKSELAINGIIERNNYFGEITRFRGER